MFDLIKVSLWGKGKVIADQNRYEEMKKHAIASLLLPYLSQQCLNSELKKEWMRYGLQQISYYIKSNYEQSNLPLSVPYVILKGTSAAQYYPYPEYRTMGESDMMTRREDLETARQQLLNSGYRVVKELNREISLIKNGIAVELHRRFATLNDPYQAQYLDDLIIDNITPSHVLPDMVNGLVLLEHIDQHMEGGIGLRQIIDWMMFVNKCLPDEKWPEFEMLAENTGLKKLAIVTTHMCEMYLGLPHREWCSKADEKLCAQLMDYTLLSGNFGNKRNTEADIIENALAYASTPKMAFKLLQKQGVKNWKAAQKHKALRPFAWIYQANRYISKGIKREQPITKLKSEYNSAKKRNAMFDAHGVKTIAKGVVIYKDGKYVKE